MNFNKNKLKRFRKRKAIEKVKCYDTKRKRVEEINQLNEINKRLSQLQSVPENFSDFPLSSFTQKGLKDAGYTKFTDIQRETVLYTHRGSDVVGAAKTGSGKTLAFVIPILEKLYREAWAQEFGVGALIITPTAELAKQIYDVINKVGRYHKFSIGLIIGGGNKLKEEKNRMSLLNIIISTPGRLLQHMSENPNFRCDDLQILVLDETDRLLEPWFLDQLNEILAFLPPSRQTLSFSATQTRLVKDFSILGLKDPIFVSAHELSKFITPERLQQKYICLDIGNKVNFLWSFLKTHLKYKIIIFVSTSKQVRFFSEVFPKLNSQILIYGLHGDMKQFRRIQAVDEFRRKKFAILVTTDIASRGLDFPLVHFVIHYDCPEDAKAYVHRSGRTARMDNDGKSLLLLLPSEKEGMLKELNKRNIPIAETMIKDSKVEKINLNLEGLMSKHIELKNIAIRAFQNYLISTSLMENKNIFDVTAINVDDFAKSLGLNVTPPIPFQNNATSSLECKPSESIFKILSKVDLDKFLPLYEVRKNHYSDIISEIHSIDDNIDDRAMKKLGLEYKPFDPTPFMNQLALLSSNNLFSFFAKYFELLAPIEKENARTCLRFKKRIQKLREVEKIKKTQKRVEMNISKNISEEDISENETIAEEFNISKEYEDSLMEQCSDDENLE